MARINFPNMYYVPPPPNIEKKEVDINFENKIPKPVLVFYINTPESLPISRKNDIYQAFKRYILDLNLEPEYHVVILNTTENTRVELLSVEKLSEKNPPVEIDQFLKDLQNE